MSEHRANVQWKRSGEFRYETYSRSHRLRFHADLVIAGSAAPQSILWFLHLACRAGFVVDAYQDDALGVLDKTWMSRVTLRPRVTYSGKTPTEEEHRALHPSARAVLHREFGEDRDTFGTGHRMSPRFCPPDKGGVSRRRTGGCRSEKKNPPLAKTARDPLVC